LQKKYGKIELYDNYDKNYELNTKVTVFNYDRSFFSKKVISDVTLEA